MAPKKVKSESSSVVKRQKPTIGLKKKIIPKHENGVHVSGPVLIEMYCT